MSAARTSLTIIWHWGHTPATRALPQPCPRLLIKAEYMEQVQKLVAWANATKTPLVPVSSGAPHFYGDTVPSELGAIILSLRHMNKIIRIDRRNRIAIIEPGVTYEQLQPELAKHGLRVTMPLLPRALQWYWGVPPEGNGFESTWLCPLVPSLPVKIS